MRLSLKCMSSLWTLAARAKSLKKLVTNLKIGPIMKTPNGSRSLGFFIVGFQKQGAQHRGPLLGITPSN